MTVWYLTRGNWSRDALGMSLPCKRCGRLPNPDGSDACLGHLPGVCTACCGHGVVPGQICYDDGHVEYDEAPA